MRLLVTADLHYNHARSRPVADGLIDQMNTAGGDVLLVVGDTASAGAGDALERCLARFRFTGPKLFVCGNHELWTLGNNSHLVLTDDLPSRVRNLGWHWLQDEPFVAGDTAIVGSIGWYDYSFAEPALGIPRRFYEKKISPGAAERFDELAELFDPSDDISPRAREVVARWNDGRFVHLHRSDEQFVDELLAQLASQLAALASMRRVIAAIHHVPFRNLLPPAHNSRWDFAKAYLGSERFGQLLMGYPNVDRLFCGHSHLAAEAHIGAIHAVNIGSGYRVKSFRQIDL